MTAATESLPQVAEAPRLSRRTAAARLVLALWVAGIVVGGVWVLLAPPVHGVVALKKSGERVQAYLGAEADHFFESAFLMLALLGAIAIIAAVAAWQQRPHRGPVMVLALMIGGLGAAGAATGVGALGAHLRYGAVDIDAAPVTPEHRVHYIVEAPAVFFGHSITQIALTIVAPAAMAALVYAVLAVGSARDDLGGYPPVEGVVLGAPVVPPLPEAAAADAESVDAENAVPPAPITTDGGADPSR